MKALTDHLHRNWWLIPLSLYIYALVSTLLLAHWGMGALAPLRAGEYFPGYTTLYDSFSDFPSLVTLWDGQWYRTIVESGYESGYSLEENRITNWAFFPLYPLLIKLLTLVGLPFWLAGSLVSVLCTGIALIVIFKLAYTYSGSLWVGVFSILLIVVNPAFFVTVSVYTEGIALLLLSLFLYGLVKERYWLVGFILILAGFTRGIGVPLFFVTAIALAVVVYKRRKITKSQVFALFAAVFSAGVWPLIVGFNLSSLTASLELLALWTTLPKYPYWVAPAAALIAILLHLNKRLPWQWRLWSAVYLGYIFATTVISAGFIRYALMALLPLPLLSERIPKRFRVPLYGFSLIVILGLGIYGQYWWFTHIWIPTSEDYLFGAAIP